MKTERVVIFYSGHVQGIGFRWACRDLAKGFAVTGYVKNLDDGRVELLAEGERVEVEEFLRAIDKSHLKPFIRERAMNWQPATGGWRDFYIEH